MTGWTAKRFWKETRVNAVDGGWQVLLDGKPVRTPAKAAMVLPNQKFAEVVAAEWRAQDDIVDPNAMPATRLANSAIDKVIPQRAEIVAMLAEYGDSDLLCYRATEPAELVLRQSKSWDPVLDWAASALGARLAPVSGLMHQPQNPAALRRLSEAVDSLEPFALAAFHDLVTLPGSLILGFAVARGHLTGEDAWEIATLDDLWQEEIWGQDEEAQTLRSRKCDEFLRSEAFFRIFAD